MLLHPLSSAERKAFTKASKVWDKRKREKKRKKSKEERSTFFAASYELTEPLLSQFRRYLLSTTAPKRKTKRTVAEVNPVTNYFALHHTCVATRDLIWVGAWYVAAYRSLFD